MPQIPEAIWGRYFRARKMRGIVKPDFLGRINGTMISITKTAVKGIPMIGQR